MRGQSASSRAGRPRQPALQARVSSRVDARVRARGGRRFLRGARADKNSGQVKRCRSGGIPRRMTLGAKHPGAPGGEAGEFASAALRIRLPFSLRSRLQCSQSLAEAFFLFVLVCWATRMEGRKAEVSFSMREKALFHLWCSIPQPCGMRVHSGAVDCFSRLGTHPNYFLPTTGRVSFQETTSIIFCELKRQRFGYLADIQPFPETGAYIWRLYQQGCFQAMCVFEPSATRSRC